MLALRPTGSVAIECVSDKSRVAGEPRTLTESRGLGIENEGNKTPWGEPYIRRSALGIAMNAKGEICSECSNTGRSRFVQCVQRRQVPRVARHLTTDRSIDCIIAI